MGEIAEAMINGDMCETCGQNLGNGLGFSRSCCDETHPNYRLEIDNNLNFDEPEIEDIEDVITCIDINISLLNEDAKELKQFNPKKAKKLHNIIKQLNIFLIALKK